MSDTYETEQADLKGRVKTLKSEIAKAKEDDDKILDFMMLIYKYNRSLFTKRRKSTDITDKR